MQVILVEQVKNLGKIGDVVDVKGGYARNFLIPGKKALRATKNNVAYFESRKKEIEKENAKLIAEAEKILKKVDGTMVVTIRQASDDGRLYGSVKAHDVREDLVKATKQDVDRQQIVLHKPIKTIGIHTVEVVLHPEVVAKINVNVARSDADAKIAEKKFKSGEQVMEGEEAPKDIVESILPDAEEEKAEAKEAAEDNVAAEASTEEATDEKAVEKAESADASEEGEDASK